MARKEREGIMLAYTADEGRISRLGDSFFAQRKYRGVRDRVEWFHNDPVQISSYGIQFEYLDHITEVLQPFKNIPLDGERYRHGWGQGRINSAALRKVNENPETAELEYHVYDIQWEAHSFWYRLQELLKMEADGLFKPPIFLAETVVTTALRWLTLMSQWLDEGYEGIILRNPITLYTMKRNVGMLKVKPTETDEYIILRANEAISKEGLHKSMVGSFTVIDREGITFDVGAGKLKHDKRKEYWLIRDKLIDQTLVVKHEPEYTMEGVPICAVAVEVKMKMPEREGS